MNTSKELIKVRVRKLKAVLLRMTDVSVMYYVYGVPWPSLVIESTDCVIQG